MVIQTMSEQVCLKHSLILIGYKIGISLKIKHAQLETFEIV